MLTTIPAKAIIPTIVIMITKGAPEITNPPKTPMRLKKIANIIIPGLETELNWKIKIKKINSSPVRNAPTKKFICFFSSSIWPVKSMLTPLGKFLKFFIEFWILETTAPASVSPGDKAE